MLASFVQLDRVLRGELTRIEVLRAGPIPIRLRGMVPVVVLLGMVSGLCVGFYAIANRDPVVWAQLAASTLKVPALFLLTLVVTFPSLYVFNALVGSSLHVMSMLRLIVAALGVTMALLASFGPIIAFFSLSTANYSFMVLVNVITSGTAGGLGLVFLLRTLHRLAAARSISLEQAMGAQEGATAPHGDDLDGAGPAAVDAAPGGAAARASDHAVHSALDPVDSGPLGAHVRVIFRIWVVVFGLVGAQMAWVLRPFIGDPTVEFTWFRPRGSSFFESVWMHVTRLF